MNLCYAGTVKYKAMLTAEDKYMLHVNAVERAKERRREMREAYQRGEIA